MKRLIMSTAKPKISPSTSTALKHTHSHSAHRLQPES